jgi:ATP-dependent Lhr-like helicase
MLDAWFAARGWVPWGFQSRAWDAYARGSDGLIVVPTGAGKTYAAIGGPLAQMIDTGRAPGPRLLYITPLRAVARDIEKALAQPIAEIGPALRVESRTGDTKASVRARQKARPPDALVTTPESLALMLTREDARTALAGVRCVIVDEWHELLVSKRGTLLELCLARLRAFAPGMGTWGMSATIPNAREALDVLCGGSTRERVVIADAPEREVMIRAIIPEPIEKLPWAGHLGMTMLPDLLGALDPGVATLVFVNTRSQAERWFHAIEYSKPEWRGVMALHHGSVDRAERERVERGLKDGTLRIVVATSSLDLGVDFSPVKRVIQIGSPKGIARVVQRAGRANHTMGGVSTVECVPTHALELLEVAAAREAFARNEIEPRSAMDKPLDVLAQHMVTCALGGGFGPDELFGEVRTAHSYRGLTREEFDWTLALVREGGVLSHYPQFRRICADDRGVYRVPGARLALVHRMNIGTITGDATLEIRYASGRKLGHIDEGFVGGLRAGQRFVFAGKVLEYVDLRDLTVVVRPATGKTSSTPIWAGTRLPISESLSAAVRRAVERAGREDDAHAPEFAASRRFFATQRRLSVIPRGDQLLVETAATREGTHLFVFPFEGRLVHAGIAALVALRLSRRRSGSFSFAVNDYGFEILSAAPYAFGELFGAWLFSREGIAEDIGASVNMSELARLAFRDVARVSGLVLQHAPGAKRTGKNLQASSSLVYDVLRDFDPQNLLLEQARREVLDRHFEQSRLGRTLDRLGACEHVFVRTRRLTPLSFPLVIERAAAKISSETIAQRLEAMRRVWESDRA